MTLQRPYKLDEPIYLRRLHSVTLTAHAAVSQRALHKMVETGDTDTFHSIIHTYIHLYCVEYLHIHSIMTNTTYNTQGMQDMEHLKGRKTAEINVNREGICC